MKKSPKVIGTSYIKPLAAYCRAHAKFHLLASDETLLSLADKRGQITLEQFINVVELVIKVTKDPALAFNILPDTEVSQHGLLGLAVLCGLNLKQALSIVLKFYRIRSKLFTLQYEEKDGRACIQIDACFPMEEAKLFAYEITLGTLYKSKKDILGLKESNCEIFFKHEKPSYSQAYLDFFDCPVHFNHHCTQMIFPSEQLKMKLKLANPETNQVLVSQCEAALNQLPDETNTKTLVKEKLRQAETPLPSLEGMADLLYLSSRTLRRHLKDHGSNYQSLLDQEKMRRARQLLDNSELSITAVAHHLGYSDAANFSKAFKKLVGNSPKQYRSQTNQPDILEL